jgi:hypothetical protein
MRRLLYGYRCTKHKLLNFWNGLTFSSPHVNRKFGKISLRDDNFIKACLTLEKSEMTSLTKSNFCYPLFLYFIIFKYYLNVTTIQYSSLLLFILSVIFIFQNTNERLFFNVIIAHIW